ncbi:GNAT family N-acetyltransferase [Nonomuraea spiralis]|uniref:GNAT family N-acetyltransferase n=1 Tax=Nonomuraea TaxID=83681 RepID=UPI00163BB29F|nr:GNAT family N-acetyltransferase [Nonomuraea sp. WAC 01424]
MVNRTEVRLELMTGDEALGRRAELMDLYREVFTGPPWNEGEGEVADFGDRFAVDAARPGFRAVLAFGDTGLCGFGTAWTTASPLPVARSYGKVLAALGPEGVDRFLVGALQVDELAVAPHARGRGLAGRILDLLCGGDRSWLLTSTGAPDAIRLYERLGWRRAGENDGIVVFTNPE